MNDYYIVAAFDDHACGEAFHQESQTTTDIVIAISIAIKYADLHDHACIIPYEHRKVFYTSDEYLKILPYAIDISVGDKVNVNKLLTLPKTP